MLFKVVIIALIVLLLAALGAVTWFLFGDKQKESEEEKDPVFFHRTQKEARPPRRRIEIVDGPVLEVRRPGEENYTGYTMTSQRYTIGHAEDCDLVIDLPSVEDLHAAIIKEIRDNQVVYHLVNYATLNPTEFYDRETDRFLLLHKKERVELIAWNVFRIGGARVRVTVPDPSEQVTDTLRLYESGREYSGSLSDEDEDEEIDL